MGPDHQLSYNPPWFRIGDSDNVYFALLYGIIAMATVWILEEIVGDTLSSGQQHITMTEVATFMTFKELKWSQLLKGFRPRTGNAESSTTPQTGLSEQRSPSRFAKFGVFIRLFVCVVEILVVFFAVTTSSKVRNYQVGYSQLTFQSSGVKIEPFRGGEWVRASVCLSDNLKYSGFNPTAFPLTCSKNATKSRLSPCAFRVICYKHANFFRIQSGRQRSWKFGHILQKQNGSSVLLPAAFENDEADEVFALKKTLEEDFSSRKGTKHICKISFTKRKAWSTFSEENRKKPAPDPKLIFQGSCEQPAPSVEEIFALLTGKLRTRKVNADSRSRSAELMDRAYLFLRTTVIGSSSRPKWCIIPAIIVVILLYVLRLVQMFIFKGESVEEKIFKYLKLIAGMNQDLSPFQVLPVIRPSVHLEQTGQNKTSALRVENSKLYSYFAPGVFQEVLNEADVQELENSKEDMRTVGHRFAPKNSNFASAWFLIGFAVAVHIFLLSFLLGFAVKEFKEGEEKRM